MTLFLLVAGIMALAMAAMGLGVILKRPCLRGSCGGPDVLTGDGESVSCAACRNRFHG